MSSNPYHIPSFDGEQLYVEVFGETKTPQKTYVFLHGLGGDLNAIIPTINALLTQNPSYRCISYDLRGHGFSSRSFPLEPNLIEQVGAYDLQAVCKFFELDQPIIVGHSLGAIILSSYLQLELGPQPLHAFLFCSPAYPAWYSLSRGNWTPLLHQANQMINPPEEKCSTEQYLNFRNSFDIDLFRLVSDIKYTGLKTWTGMWLATLGFEQSLPSIDRNNITFVYGKYDFLLPEKKQAKYLEETKNLNIVCMMSNHHQPYTKFPLEVTSIITNY